MFKRLFKKTKYITVSPEKLEEFKAKEPQEDVEIKVGKGVSQGQKPNIPTGMWLKCNKCGQVIYKKDLEGSYKVCGFCTYHIRLSAQERIEQIIDQGTWTEINENIKSQNPLDFEGYPEKIKGLEEKTGLDEAVVSGIGKINDQSTVLCIMDSRFMMGSMGSVVGEKLTRAVEKAIEENLHLVVFTASGGARMQEGIFSLMQMAKVSAAISKLNEAGLLYIPVLTDPTTGGVTASFAMLGDVILSEPRTLIGFAGKRVIEQTIKQKLPEGFQSAEFLLEKGFVDKIVHREDLKQTLGDILKMHNFKGELDNFAKNDKKQILPDKLEKIDRTPFEKVKLARKIERPTSLDYINVIFDNFIELHGDRYFGDDSCVVGGLAYLNGTPVTVIGQQKGRDLKENIKRNFGMPNPEGYRKALRLMKQAEKFNRPVICFADTPGAYCGIGAEERGQGEAIAQNLTQMASLKTPIISIVIGEGGSGGALALTVADEIYMLENAIFSVLSPEGFASILWKNAGRAQEAANIMKITAQDLKDFGIIEKIIPEPKGDASLSPKETAKLLKQGIVEGLSEKLEEDIDRLLEKRYNKFRKIGQYIES
ncbi:acetyl-CoA carboxylase carboxyltransferase subunit alpha [Proteinivorax hydrogeniformans]|uniref:Multifunctional fusion protein n=1 Tax=Proteinivorax hydrogeniformans TaxID=1826727 RepID=A0AAU8HVJ4_9FIRM